MDFMFLKLLYLFKLSEMEYNTYDYFFWMPLDVQPIRSFWIDGIYEQVFFNLFFYLIFDKNYFIQFFFFGGGFNCLLGLVVDVFG